MTFDRPRESSAARQGEGDMKPAKCPECASKKIGTLAAIVTRDTYWRCHECGTIWNELRYRQQHKRQW
jgi:transposase-like protein